MEEPPLDANEFRESGHRLVDRIADLLAGIDERPLFPADATPSRVDALFDEPVPRRPASMASLLATIEEKLLPNCTHVNHPGYFGLITPSPLPAGILADLLASALNQNVGAYSIGPAATAIERRVGRWLCDLAGYGAGSDALLTSGGMMANFIGMKLGRDFASGDRAQHAGIEGRLAAYTSDERHVSVDKSADAVGIGRDGLRVIDSDGEFRLRIDALEAAIARDKSAGVRPAVLVAMAGSTNTGAVDDFRALRRIADREGMWLHADAAYGGGMLLSRRFGGILAGVSLADSITIDPHKWFYAPLDAGAILVRDAGRLLKSFGLRPPYLSNAGEAADAGEKRYDFFVHGFEQSRRFRGLKVWMGLKRHGTDAIGEWVDANVDHATRLHELATAHPRFESAVRPRMSAVCVRYAAPGLDDAALDRLHAAVTRRVEAGRKFWFSTTVLKGRAHFRVCPVNFRTRREHIDDLFATLEKECDAVASELRARTA
jgi:aromatic-L-amino-acid decarboxylase